MNSKSNICSKCGKEFIHSEETENIEQESFLMRKFSYSEKCECNDKTRGSGIIWIPYHLLGDGINEYEKSR